MSVVSVESNARRSGGEGERNVSTDVERVDRSAKARYWILTMPFADFTPYLPPGVNYIVGQLERGEGGFLHWQVMCAYGAAIRMSGVKKTFGERCHCEPTRSKKAEDYVQKEDTRVEGTEFTLGKRSFKRNNPADWGEVLEAAKCGRFEDIPPDIYVRYYGNIKRISVENAQAVAGERSCSVFWGPTGTGKSRTAWAEAGLDAYPKDPNSKFWDGYRGQVNVVIDEFRGTIGISHLLRWLDRYPVLVEVKGSSTVFKAEKIWITSNLHPREWYKDVDESTVLALLRRMNIVEMN
jgi:hypothetical protein